MDKQYEDRIQHVFDSYCRRVLKNAANDYYDEVERKGKHEILLEECWNTPYSFDRYTIDAHVYRVFGEDVVIENCAVVEALNTLPADNRLIVLAAYCVGLPDRVVAERMHLIRRTVAYRKARTLSELRRMLKDEQTSSV